MIPLAYCIPGVDPAGEILQCIYMYIASSEELAATKQYPMPAILPEQNASMLSPTGARPISRECSVSRSLPSVPLSLFDPLLHDHVLCPAHPHDPAPALHIPNPPIAPPPAPFCAASPCIFSLTLRLTSKNLLTQRSRHTLSPLLRSGSRYSGGMHFFVQDCDNLCAVLSVSEVFVVVEEKVGVSEAGVRWMDGWVPVEHVRYHLDLGFRRGDFLRRGELGSAAEEEGHDSRLYGWLFCRCR